MKATRTCSFPECGRRTYGRAICPGHTYQQRKGQPLAPIKPRRVSCEVDDCERKHYSKGYCQKHYERVRNHGTPDRLLPAGAWERFEFFAEKTETCWLWRGKVDAYGYAKIREDNRSYQAHRFAYARLVGPIPDGLELDHLCRVRHCVNPDHLDPVTTSENLYRARVAAKMTDEDYGRWVEERTGGRMGA